MAVIPPKEPVKETVVKETTVKETVPPPPTKTTKINRKDELLYLMEQIVKEANGISNIGQTSIYWDYLREYQLLNSTP